MTNSKNQINKDHPRIKARDVFVQEDRDNLAQSIKNVKGHILPSDVKQLLISELLKKRPIEKSKEESIKHLEQQENIKTVIDNYFSSANNFFLDNHYGDTNKLLPKLQLKLNPDIKITKTVELMSLIENTNIINKIKEGNNIFCISSHPFACSGCGGVVYAMNFIEVVIKNNNMVIVTRDNQPLYVTSEGVLECDRNENILRSGSYEKLGLLGFLSYIQYAQEELSKSHSMFRMKKYEKNDIDILKPVEELSYSQIKPLIIEDNSGKEPYRFFNNNNEERGGFTGDIVKHFSNTLFAKEFGLTEDDIRNVRYNPNNKKSV